MGEVVSAVVKPVAKVAGSIIGGANSATGGALLGTPDTSQIQSIPRDFLSQQAAGLKIRSLEGLESLTNRPTEALNSEVIANIQRAKQRALIGEAGQESRRVQQQAEDERRDLQSILRSRGLSGSSLGIAGERGTQRRMEDQLKELDQKRREGEVLTAQIPLLQYTQQQEDLDNQLRRRLNLIGATPFQGEQTIQQTVAGSPGLLGLIGAGVGGAIGGTKGAATGAEVGTAATPALRGLAR